MSIFQDIFKHAKFAKPQLQTHRTKKQDLGATNLNIPSLAALTFVSMLGHFSHNYLRGMDRKIGQGWLGKTQPSLTHPVRFNPTIRGLWN